MFLSNAKSLIKQNNNMDINARIEMVAIINNSLSVKEKLLDEQVNNAMPQVYLNLTMGKMIGLIELRDYLQESIEAEISAMETAQGM
jgi:hypothetical protein